MGKNSNYLFVCGCPLYRVICSGKRWWLGLKWGKLSQNYESMTIEAKTNKDAVWQANVSQAASFVISHFPWEWVVEVTRHSTETRRLWYRLRRQNRCHARDAPSFQKRFSGALSHPTHGKQGKHHGFPWPTFTISVGIWHGSVLLVKMNSPGLSCLCLFAEFSKLYVTS